MPVARPYVLNGSSAFVAKAVWGFGFWVSESNSEVPQNPKPVTPNPLVALSARRSPPRETQHFRREDRAGLQALLSRRGAQS